MHDQNHEQRLRQPLRSKHYQLTVVQHPEESRALAKQDKARGAKWPLDPPPVIEFKVHDNDPNHSYLHSPFWFCTASLETISTSATAQQPKGLVGTTVSSLHKVKLSDGKPERGYFIFGDLNVKNAGTHRLKFSLFEMRQPQEGSSHMVAELLTSAESREFKVHPSKTHVAARESTTLSKQLCEAGVKLRIRKESQNKRQKQQWDWSANRAQVLGSGLQSLPRTLVTPLPPQPMLPPHNAGEDVRSRLSLTNGSTLGIRSHMNDAEALNRNERSINHVNAWANEQQQQWSPENWSHQQPQQPFSMPPTTSSSYQLSSGRTAFNPPAFSSSQASMPPPMYTMHSNGLSQPQNYNLRGSDSSYFEASYTQLSHSGVTNVDDHSAAQGFGFPSFTNNTSLTTVGYDPYQSRGVEDAPRGSYMAFGGGSGNSAV